MGGRTDRNGEHAEIEITSGSGTYDFNRENGGEHWDLQLSPEIPIEMEVQAGASQAELDLTRLLVPELEVEVGAAQLHLRLPAHGIRWQRSKPARPTSPLTFRRTRRLASARAVGWRSSQLIRRPSRALTIPMSTSRRAMTHRPTIGLTWRSGPAWPKSRYARCRSLGRPGNPRAAVAAERVPHLPAPTLTL